MRTHHICTNTIKARNPLLLPNTSISHSQTFSSSLEEESINCLASLISTHNTQTTMMQTAMTHTAMTHTAMMHTAMTHTAMTRIAMIQISLPLVTASPLLSNALDDAPPGHFVEPTPTKKPRARPKKAIISDGSRKRTHSPASNS